MNKKNQFWEIWNSSKGAALLCFCLCLLSGVVSAQNLDIRPLGTDPWVTGPESLTNGGVTLSNPVRLPQCTQRVPLWVVDVGIAIPDAHGRLSMVVGGDTFYHSRRSKQDCELLTRTLLFHCKEIQLMPPLESYYEAECRSDADCTRNSFRDWRCDSASGICVLAPVHALCHRVFQRKDDIRFCYDARGGHPIPGDPNPTRGEAFCDWLQGDFRCKTELYDDTCDPECFTHGGFAECEHDPCNVECIQACNRAGYCRHRNQTFFSAQVVSDGEGGHWVKLLEDHPQYFISRVKDEWKDVNLFGVYPGDYFRDRSGNLYLFTDTRTWAAPSLEKELLRSGLGIYSLSENQRFTFSPRSIAVPPVKVWHGLRSDSAKAVTIRNPSKTVLWARGSNFSEAVVIRDLSRDPYRPRQDRDTYIHVLGSGPACSMDIPGNRSGYTDHAALARVPDTKAALSDPVSWEYFAGLKDGRSEWIRARSADGTLPQEQAASIFSFSGFRSGTVLRVGGEYLHLDTVPNRMNGKYTIQHLLRSPDGITWFDGGTFDILAGEDPPRTAEVYSTHWLPFADTSPDLGFLLSHWLSYEGYFQSSTEESRFRDYNMKSYRMAPPRPRSYLVSSQDYTTLSTQRRLLPVSYYRAAKEPSQHLVVQFCVCPPQGDCKEMCRPWESFHAQREPSHRWRTATKLSLNGQKARFQKALGMHALTLPNRTKAGVPLLRMDLPLVWQWDKEAEAPSSAVLLRFGIVSEESATPLDDLHSSMRILPAFYREDSRLWQEPGGWYTTQPLVLTPSTHP